MQSFCSQDKYKGNSCTKPQKLEKICKNVQKTARTPDGLDGLDGLDCLDCLDGMEGDLRIWGFGNLGTCLPVTS
jgi:hypothetical protein